VKKQIKKINRTVKKLLTSQSKNKMPLQNIIRSESALVEINLEEHFNPILLAEVEKAFRDNYQTRLIRIVQAIILAKRDAYFETLDPNLTIELKPDKSLLRIVLRGVPHEKLVKGKLIKIKERQILCGIRDLLVSRQYPLNDKSHESLTQYIFHFVRSAEVLTRTDRERNELGRVMIQGGHHIPRHEKIHHKRLGYGIGLLGLELITGSGPGSMEEPMKGAIRGYQMNCLERKFIGITEDGIISGEPCNDYIDHLIVFPDIEKRLEAFIRMSRAGIIFPGGPGTFEEILTILWIKTHPLNKFFRFPLYCCQPQQSGNYFKNIFAFLHECFDIDFEREGYLRYFESETEDKTNPLLDPRRVSYEIEAEMRDCLTFNERRSRKIQRIFSPLWDWDVYFPSELQHPLIISKELIEGLEFSRKMPMEKLFYSIRSLSSAIVECNVRNRNFIKEQGVFKLRGDKTMLKRLDELFQSFAEEKRMGGREYQCPYQIL